MWIIALLAFDVLLFLIAPRVERYVIERGRVVRPYLDDRSQAWELEPPPAGRKVTPA